MADQPLCEGTNVDGSPCKRKAMYEDSLCWSHRRPPVDKPKCAARGRTSKKPCERYPARGLTVCHIHGAGTKKAKAKSLRIQQEAKEARRREREMERSRAKMEKAVKTLGLPEDVSPTEALLSEIRWTAGHVNWLRERVQELEVLGKDLIYGTTSTVLTHSPKFGTTEKTTEEFREHVWYTLYKQERDHLVKVSTAALRAGVEERRITLAEQQGLLVAQVIHRILDAIGLSPAQWTLVQDVVPRELRMMAGD